MKLVAVVVRVSKGNISDRSYSSSVSTCDASDLSKHHARTAEGTHRRQSIHKDHRGGFSLSR